MDSRLLQGARSQNDYVRALLVSLCRVNPSSSRLAALSSLISLAVCAVALLLFLHTSDRASVFERPTQSSVLGFLGAGLGLIGASYAVRGSTSIRGDVEERIPLGEDELDGIKFHNLSGAADSIGKASSRPHVVVGLLAVAITLRAHTFESVNRNMQCGLAGVEAFVPFFTAILDYRLSSIQHVQPALDELPVKQRLMRYIGPPLIVAWANNLIWRVAASPRSSLICPATRGTTSWVIAMQFLGLALDSWILHTLPSVLNSLQPRVKAPARRIPLLLGFLFIGSAFLIATTGLMTAILPRYRAILSNLHYHYLNNLCWETFCFIMLCLFGSYWVSNHSGTDLAIVLSFAGSGYQIWPAWSNALESTVPYLYLPYIPPFLLLFLGTCLYFYSMRHSKFFDSESRNRHYRALLLILGVGVIGLSLFRAVLGGASAPFLPTHPIDTLIEHANNRHIAWSRQAAQSATLEQAVDNYLKRYNRHPPPSFDKWYQYAKERQSVVIDDFDTIEENLRPFWKVDPRTLRMKTQKLLLDEENECAEVTVRNKNATIGKVRGTHAWMITGIIDMMKPFMKDLPDMTIAFNINDEPRVAVPHATWQILDQQQATPEQPLQLSDKWASNGAQSWEIPKGESLTPPKMQLFSFRRQWRLYGAAMCPPDSPAWTTHFWDSTTQCTKCYAPHSYEQFISNWTLAGSPCHQPDLANLHGFYLSPSAFLPTNELIPIFSQSRAGGFADILYPNPWNYIDKVKYAPNATYPDDDFVKKESTLFWHGGTTEGFSRIGTWRAHARQRVVHLVNNSTMKSNVLLPAAGGGFRYADLTTGQFLAHPRMRTANLSTEVRFVHDFPRCDNGDCEAQKAAFGLGQATGFQHHWRHRYLLDADGAGFSGRFLPFLQSHAVPFKMAIFREWYDDRLTAWKHFVPIDIRLHGLWSTLAYFAGKFGAKKGAPDPARQIAEDGRAWAEKVLRKEDMEIYFYRLLLEYARVMSDDRATLGYRTSELNI